MTKIEVLRMNYLLILMISLLGSCLALAQAQTEPKPTAKISIKEDGNLYFETSDGRVAELQSRSAGNFSYKTHLKMTENLCQTENLLSPCKAFSKVKPIEISLVWTKNPDTSRLNKPVIFDGNNEVKRVFAENSPEIGSTVLQCENFKWLNGTDNLARFRKFDVWGNEINTINTETDANENLTYNGAFNIHLTPLYGSYYALSTDQYFSSISGAILVTSGIVHVVTTSPKTHESCQIQFMNDPGNLSTKFREFILKLEKVPFQKAKINPAYIHELSSNLRFYVNRGFE